ncbi:MAG: NAD(P)H-hydrate dehydratase [Lachnospiraceae bacterium]|nr:NAD(P)H-hydrate dehydratase [Lachnospiraceae bacterium]
MTEVLSVENMRASDAATIAGGTSGRELMMRAARGIFDAAAWKAPAAIICGTGNNAGDGYALALLLEEAGIFCELFLITDRFTEDGGFFHAKCLERGIPEHLMRDTPSLKGYGTVADCLLGTGFHGEPREEIKDAIEKINASGAYVVAADICSGLSGDSGMGTCYVRADLTVSVGGYKPGHFLNLAKDASKVTVNADIGIRPVMEPYGLVEASDLRPYFSDRPHFSHKGTYGYLALLGGSDRYSGAIRLAYLANAAMRSGAGVVKVAVPASIRSDVAVHILESTLFPMPEENGGMRFDEGLMGELISNVKTAAIGPGIGRGEEIRKILHFLLTGFSGRLIIDADGLSELAQLDPEVLRSASCEVILTPHLKEFSRLSGKAVPEITEDPIGTAREYASEHGCILLLKGPATVITDGQRVLLTDRGCPGMATAGSGDVLTGILAATCARMEDPLMAAAAGAYLNGLAGELAESSIGPVSMVAGDTVAAIPEAVRRLGGISQSGPGGVVL